MAAKKYVSTVAFVGTALFCLGVASLGTGGIVDACNQYGLASVSHADCRAFWAGALGRSPTAQAKSLVAFALIFPRIEAALFLGLGAGSVYALRNPTLAAAVHLMQAVFFSTASSIHAHNAGLLPFEVDPNLKLDGAEFVPFMAITGVLAALSWAGFVLSKGAAAGGAAAAKLNRFTHEPLSESQAKDKAARMLQGRAQARSLGKEEREKTDARKRRSSIGTAQL